MPKHKVSGVLIACLLSCVAGAAGAQEFTAEAVKAAFLYRFAMYVQWPPDAPQGPLVIGVAGSDDLAQQLETLLPRISAQGRATQLRRVARPGDLDGVHILYVGPDSLKRARSLCAAAATKPILLVTDGASDFECGAVINFIEANRNVRFEISLGASDRARLKIDSALLSVAARVADRGSR